MDRSNAQLDGGCIKSDGYQHSVHDGVSRQHGEACYEFQPARHPAWIHGLAHIMLNEPLCVASLASQGSQSLLERGERARPASQIHEGRPQNDWNVQPSPRRIECNEEAADHSECCEEKVDDQYRVGSDAITHEAHSSAI